MATGSAYTVKLGADTSAISTAIKEVTNKTYTVTVKTDTSGATSLTKEVEKTTSVMEDGSKKAETLTKSYDENGKMTKTLTTRTSATNKAVQTMGQTFLDTTAKVAKFYTSTLIIQAFTSVISSAKEAIVDFDDSITELRKVTDLGGDSLESYKEQAYDLADALSTSATNVTDAVTEFSKSGYSLDESLALAESALVFQTIADGAVTASDSATLLVQTMKAYSMSVEEAEKVIDSINEVSNNYSVSSSDLSESIGKVASSASLAGVGFDELLGLILGLEKPI